MLEDGNHAKQSNESSSHPAKEVVPTSDDEDIYFISQSSDKLSSSSSSAHVAQHTAPAPSEDDDEPVLPLRAEPLVQADSQSAHVADGGLQKTATNSISMTQQTPPNDSTSELDSALVLPSSQPTSPICQGDAVQAQTLSPESVTRLLGSQEKDDRTLDSTEHADVRRPAPEGSGRGSMTGRENGLDLANAADDENDITIRREARTDSPTQRSDLTLPLTPDRASSRQQTPSLSPVLADPGPSRSQPISIRESPHPLDATNLLPMNEQDDVTNHVREASQSSQNNVTKHTTNLEPFASSTPPLPPLRIPNRAPAPEAPPIQSPRSPQRTSTTTHQKNHDELVARTAAAQPPTPPRRQLRARKAAQLNPYTLEAMRYQRTLIRNDWQDAVVSQSEWHRQERRRLAEEATKAQREVQGVNGSEESQNQWLVPSSGPSSQADADDMSVPSSPPAPSIPDVLVEIPALGEADPSRAPANHSRVRASPPTPSQIGTLPELSEMLAGPSRTGPLQARSNLGRPGPSTHATYKGPRTTAQTRQDAPASQVSSARESTTNEEESAPLPAPVRRKHPLRALISSDDDKPAAVNEPSSVHPEAVTVDSSEDERPAPTLTAPRVRRRSRWSGDGSSSDSTDYERRFRQLKKMMPAGMARKHIRDLRAMRHGKAYHSDGHVSSSSSDARNGGRPGSRPQVRPAETEQISGDESLQPGQTRKRLRRHDSLDGNAALLIDPDSDSSSSSASSLSSDASMTLTRTSFADTSIDRDHTARHDEAEEVDEAPPAWWSVNRLDSYVPYRERDAVDRMLSRTGGRKPSSKTTARKMTALSSRRQARLDGFVATYRHRERQSDSSRSHLMELDQNQRGPHRPLITVNEKYIQPWLSKRKKKKRKLDPRVGRTSTAGPRHGPVILRNPPVVRPRVQPRLDLEHHEVLFAPDPHRALGAHRSEEEGKNAGHLSDDDEQWQDLGSIMMDSTPVVLSDTRLAMPRPRTAAALQQYPEPTHVRRAAATPARASYASPSASLASGGHVGLNHLTDHSPGTPTRPRSEAVSHTATRPRFDQLPSVSKAVTVAKEGEVWDDFQGISLDFGITSLTGSIDLNVTTSALLTRLPELIALPDRLLHRQIIPRTWSGDVLRLDDTVLSTDMDHEMLSSKLPFYMDNLRLHISRSFDAGGSEGEPTPIHHTRNLVADTGAFLGCWLVRQAEAVADGTTDASSLLRSYRMILERVEQLQASVLSQQDSSRASKASREERKLICLHLTWTRFELCWRAMAICDADANHALEPDAPTVESLLAYSRALMSILLHQGLHRSVRNLRKAASSNARSGIPPAEAMDVDADTETTVSIDEPTSMWLGVIHILDSFEKSRGIADGRLFWTQFEAAYHRWDASMPKRAPLLRSESLWYCLFAVTTLSQLSPSGDVQAAPLLRECWPLVTRALHLVKFRSDESNEMAMGWHMLAKRDAYVKIVLQRCCLLASELRWTMDGADSTLARLFDIFNSQKLADLPTEADHDFPAFLRDFDVKKLAVADAVEGEAIQDPSFHLFVRLLAQAGRELRDSASDAKDGDRRVSRLFSRMTPVRVMPFTRNDVPTSSQRSVLFNHYSVFMLFLHLVPASSPQRLRQIQSFLPAFKDADFLSQVTYIRAMMYVAVIFRHHQLDLTPVTRWFGDTITVLRREYEEIESTTKQFERQQMQQSLHQKGRQQPPQPESMRMASIFENAPARQAALRRKEEVARLLVVALRSIQHVIRNDNLDGGRTNSEGMEERQPDMLLLSSAWTQQMLEAQISLEPRIGQEVLKCIQTFLLARIRALQPATTTPATNSEDAVHSRDQAQQAGNEESQDSFAELFEADDDFDFEDPMLAKLLDGGEVRPATGGDLSNGPAETAAAERRKWDREFGYLIKKTISPSLFQLLSNVYHPDRRMEAAATGSVVMRLGVTERLTDPSFDMPGEASRTSASRRKMDQLVKAAEARQFLELVVDCWAGCAHVLVSNGLREWSSYLGFGNESWKRIDDPIGRRDVGLRFLQNVVSLDPSAVERKEYEVELIAVWIQTAVARVLSVQDVYTMSLIQAASQAQGKAPLLSALAEPWTAVLRSGMEANSDTLFESGHTPPAFDLDTFTSQRQALLSSCFDWLSSSLAAGTASIGTAYSILSALLSSLRAYIEDTPASEAGGNREYLLFCETVLSDLESKLRDASVLNSLRSEFDAATQLVKNRLSAINASATEAHL
ncbi:hypothetical protein NDA17_001139 [Ustilago hordei]|nr:hypothetical protein NDA17_001139 [Ustilago hordei]